MELLRSGSLTKWSIDGCARGAQCAKGLVIHYFGSRDRLLAESAKELVQARAAGWRRALGSAGVGALDLLWEQIAGTARDGSGRALIELRLAGVPGASLPDPEARQLAAGLARALEASPDELPDPAALEPILEGYLLALLGGATPEAVREAFFRYWLSYVG